jgi:hypothetical protein
MARPPAWNAYDPNAELPLFGYVLLVALFVALVGTGIFLLRRRRDLLTTLRWPDLALLAVATHQLTWMLARDRVLAPFRAFFAKYEGSADVGELNESARGAGVWRAVADLVTGPYCLGPWVAAFLLFAYLKQPRATRLAAILLSLVAASNVLHQLYTLLKHANGL